MTKNQKTADQLVEDMRTERDENAAQGIGVFDGGTAWPEFCKQMGDAVLNGTLEDDADDK